MYYTPKNSPSISELDDRKVGVGDALGATLEFCRPGSFEAISDMIGGGVAHYHILGEKPTKKLIKKNKLTGEFEFVENISSNVQSIYIPIVGLTRSTFRFPIE